MCHPSTLLSFFSIKLQYWRCVWISFFINYLFIFFAKKENSLERVTELKWGGCLYVISFFSFFIKCQNLFIGDCWSSNLINFPRLNVYQTRKWAWTFFFLSLAISRQFSILIGFFFCFAKFFFFILVRWTNRFSNFHHLPPLRCNGGRISRKILSHSSHIMHENILIYFWQLKLYVQQWNDDYDGDWRSSSWVSSGVLLKELFIPIMLVNFTPFVLKINRGYFYLAGWKSIAPRFN